MIIPFELDLVSFEEVFLGNRSVKTRDVEDLDSGRKSLKKSAGPSLEPGSHTFRSGMKTAIECFSPGDTAKSATPSTRSLFHTVPRSPLS